MRQAQGKSRFLLSAVFLVAGVFGLGALPGRCIGAEAGRCPRTGWRSRSPMATPKR